MCSAADHPEVVQEYIAKECAERWTMRPFDPSKLPEVQATRFRVIPKRNSNGWWLVLDLSSPEGWSMNNGINPDLCSLSHVTIDDAARAIMESSPGSKLAKIDIKGAYRIVLVHPEDRPLLGMIWGEGLYVDAVLPLGLHSALKTFTALANDLECVIKGEGVQTVLYYLDDFLNVAATNSKQSEDLQKLLAIFDRLHIPLAIENLEGPAVVLIFLGIELDAQAMILHLPAGKLQELKNVVAKWQGKNFCVKKDLQSLVRKLQHARSIIRPGRTFLWRMFELLKVTSKKQHFIRLNTVLLAR